MDATYVKKAKELLLKEQERLENEIEHGNKFPQYGSSEDDNAQEVEQYQEAVGLKSNLNGLLKAVKKALKKIDEGTYGICEVCGDKIELGRLKAFPEATTCVTHASKR